MRAFIAIDLPQNIKEKIGTLQENLKKCDVPTKWVNPENLHLTMKFLGEIEDKQMRGIKKAVAETSKEYNPFDVNFENFGFFPNERKPRVFFVSTSAETLLKSIADLLEEKLQMLGFKERNLPAGRQGRFKSHITLARIENLKNINCLIKESKNIKLQDKIPIKEITLFKSTLINSNPIYEVIFKSSLKP